MQEPVLWPLGAGAGAARKKIPRGIKIPGAGAGVSWEKKSGAGAAKKLDGSPALGEYK